MIISFGHKVLYIGIFDKYYSSFREAITFIDLQMGCCFVGDHSPRINFLLILFNIKLFEVEWYDVRHREHGDEFLDLAK